MIVKVNIVEVVFTCSGTAAGQSTSWQHPLRRAERDAGAEALHDGCRHSSAVWLGPHVLQPKPANALPLQSHAGL